MIAIRTKTGKLIEVKDTSISFIELSDKDGNLVGVIFVEDGTITTYTQGDAEFKNYIKHFKNTNSKLLK